MAKIEERSWNDFWASFWRIEDRHKIPGIFQWDKELVDFIECVCDLKPGYKLLDLGCGGGDQAKLFAQKGYRVTGIDIAPALIEFAKNQFQDQRLQGTFIIKDMRDIDYDKEFDAVLILSGTFGFFGQDDDLKLLHAINKALKFGGKIFIMFMSANRELTRKKSWSENKHGLVMQECWIDMETSTYQSRIYIVKNDGTIIRPKDELGYHANEVIRCYTIPEIKFMLANAGLKYITSYSCCDFSLPPKESEPDAERNIVVAKK